LIRLEVGGVFFSLFSLFSLFGLFGLFGWRACLGQEAKWGLFGSG